MEARIIRSKRKTVAIQIRNGEVIVRAPLRMKNEEIEKFLRMHSVWIEKKLTDAKARKEELDAIEPLSPQELDALVKEAKRVIPQRVEHYAKQMGVSFGRISIRKQRSRWGSCSAEGNLNFNCLLMLAPSEVLDSVVAHELCHLKRMDHSSAFYAELYSVFPKYKECKEWLTQNGEALMCRLGNKD